MKIDVDWSRSTVRAQAQAKLTRFIKTSVVTHLGNCPDIGCLSLDAVKVCMGGDPHKNVKIVPLQMRGSIGVPVAVRLEGTQAIQGFLSAPGMTTAKLQELIELGPWQKPKTDKVSVSATPPKVDTQEQVAPVAETKEALEPVAAVANVSEKRTPLQVLRSNRVPDEEIDRIRGTLARLVYDNTSETERSGVGATVQLPVSVITKAILEHAGLSPNLRGNYQGIIGAFYASKLALFAYKGYADPQSDESYIPWLIDVKLVLDFVGGYDKLAALARTRRQEVEQREATRLASPDPVKAVEVAEAVASGLSDVQVLDLARAALLARQGAEYELQAAQTNLAEAKLVVQELQKQLDAAQSAVVRAHQQVVDAEMRLRDYSVAPNVASALNVMVEKARSRLSEVQALVAQLGLDK